MAATVTEKCLRVWASEETGTEAETRTGTETERQGRQRKPERQRRTERRDRYYTEGRRGRQRDREK